MTLSSYQSWYFSARIALSFVTAAAQLFLLTLRYVFSVVYDAFCFSAFCLVGSFVMACKIVTLPVRVFYWIIVVYDTNVPGPTRVPGSFPNGRTLHRKLISRGVPRYLPRISLRFLVFSAYQVCPTWAYVLHGSDHWFGLVFRRIVNFDSVIFGLQNKLISIQYRYLPTRIWNSVDFCLIFISFGLVALLIFGQLIHSRLSHNPKLVRAGQSHIKVIVPTKFRLQGRNNRSSRSKSRRSVYTSVKQICVLEASLDDEEAISFDDTTNCMVDNCANTHIWNCKDDFVPGSLKSIS